MTTAVLSNGTIVANETSANGLTETGMCDSVITVISATQSARP